MFSIILGGHYSYQKVEPEDNWMLAVTYPAGDTEEFELEDTDEVSSKIKHRQKGTKIVLTNKVPASDDETDTVFLKVFSNNAAVTVKAGGKEIFSHGMDDLKYGHSIGDGIFTIPVSGSYSGKELTISMVSGSSGSFKSFTFPRMFETDGFMSDEYLYSNFFNVGAYGFMILFGIFMTFCGAVRIFYNQNFTQALNVGIFSFFSGIYGAAKHMYFQRFCSNTLDLEYMEKVAMMAIPVVLILYIRVAMNDGNKEFAKRMKILSIAAECLSSINLVLMIAQVLSFEALDGIFVTFYAAMIIVVLRWTRLYVQFNRNNIVMITGYIIYFILLFIEVVGGYFLSFYNVTINWAGTGFSFGTIVFLCCICYSYLDKYFYDYKINKKNMALVRMAFTDAMTGLYNRAKLDEVFSGFNSHDVYSIISFDLNYLKRTNDKYGHKAGDALLMSFVNILKKSFSDLGPIFRMGGDEFMVVIRTSPYSIYVMKAFDTMNKLIDEENNMGHEYTTSVAYGSACSDEFDRPTYDKVNSLADKRMYEMKQKMKAENKAKDADNSNVEDDRLAVMPSELKAMEEKKKSLIHLGRSEEKDNKEASKDKEDKEDKKDKKDKKGVDE